MAQLVQSTHHASLDDYERIPHLGFGVREMKAEAETLLPRLGGRRVFMVNSTAQGGGVAELLPGLITLMRDLGIDANWLVMQAEEPEFFALTKRIHNLIHGHGDADLGNGERALYEEVSRKAAGRIREHLRPGDILVVHDPQPMGAGALLRQEMDITAIWRCHIGLDDETDETRAAWGFLEEWAGPYDHSVFTAPEYIPACLAGRATVIHPSIDPLADKNRDLSVRKIVGILANGGLVRTSSPTVTEAYPEIAERMQADGSWAPATEPEDLGLLFRPIVTQISRWDRLKGYLPLMQAFVSMKETLKADGAGLSPERRRPLELARLVLAGPDPKSVTDDPEGLAALQEVREAYCALSPDLREAIAIISLPMASRRNNALLVNALQRCSDVVVQNSIQEGFGLTVTEAMWKHAAILGSSAAGLRQQIRPDLDGCLVKNPEDPHEIAAALKGLLQDQAQREAFGSSAQQRVHADFLVFSHVRNWLRVIASTLELRYA
ncbi:glycosyltransferase [Afifella sp. IM 167]|uniref:glycosyltransferase n=1 Tax=Afifella sp. IM 167 TaxID=2033586 RepID=UPI001CCD5610|nr:glycosyltransferase [Afifella sp. IM 167]MBZ8133863.1 glycosyl transferase family 1 [Afifella sp. IM 167]